MNTDTIDAAQVPGFRRRIRIEPQPRAVAAMVEDDIHCMGVILRHDGSTVGEVVPLTPRMPWNTCPGAAAKLVETFEGQALSEVTAKRDKKQNCTHLHDMAVLAAAHAFDSEPTTFDIYASDPVDGVRLLEVRRNGQRVHRWIERDGLLEGAAGIEGQSLLGMRDWISNLGEDDREAARLLQWGSLIAHGRTMSAEEQSEAAALPANCYTLQPERAVHAKRVGDRFDFSEGSRVPLADIADTLATMLQ